MHFSLYISNYTAVNVKLLNNIYIHHARRPAAEFFFIRPMHDPDHDDQRALAAGARTRALTKFFSYVDRD